MLVVIVFRTALFFGGLEILWLISMEAKILRSRRSFLSSQSYLFMLGYILTRLNVCKDFVVNLCWVVFMTEVPVQGVGAVPVLVLVTRGAGVNLVGLVLIVLFAGNAFSLRHRVCRS